MVNIKHIDRESPALVQVFRLVLVSVFGPVGMWLMMNVTTRSLQTWPYFPHYNEDTRAKRLP